MRKKLKSVGTWICLRAPYITIIIMLLIFSCLGSVAIEGEEFFQIVAFITALLQIAALIITKKRIVPLIADLLAVFWFITWDWEIYQQLYPNKAGWFAVITYPAIGIFIAFGAPIRAKIFSPPRKFRRTPNYGENLSPHFSDARKRKG